MNEFETISANISKITHEIRNPITLIDTYLHLLLKDHPELTNYEYFNHITSNMNYLKVLLNDITSYSNSCHVQKTSIHLYSFLCDFMNELNPVLAKKNLHITLKKQSALPPLEADATKLRQALHNLVRNSAEAMQANGEITICVYFKNLSIILTVEDEGPGIPSEFLPTLFEPFVTHKEDGTGLGLAIVKNVMEAHGGTVQAENKADGGAKFSLVFPL